jgi:hypothetical protein
MYRTLGILVLLFLGVTSLKADPVILTGGTLVFNDIEPGCKFTLTGPGTVINGGNSTLHTVQGGSLLVNSGQTITGLRLGGLDSQDGELGVPFPVTVAGITYNSGNVILLQLQPSTLAPFVVPGPASGFVLTAPLTLTGGIFGFNGPGLDNQFFFNSLSAVGTQVLTFRTCFVCNPNLNVFILESWVLNIGPTVSGVTIQSVPEPSSVLLLISSVSALSWMRRRKKLKG